MDAADYTTEMEFLGDSDSEELARIYKTQYNNLLLLIANDYAARLENGGGGKKATPADVLAKIGTLPDPSIIYRIFLLDEDPPETAGDGLERPAIATYRSYAEGGHINLYRLSKTDRIDTVLLHAWATLLKGRFALESHLFDRASFLEEDGYYFNELTREYVEENWAVHIAEVFLGSDRNSFDSFLENAPIRAAVLARAIGRAIDRTFKGDYPNPHIKLFAQRVVSANESVLPVVTGKLSELAMDNSKPDGRAALELLIFLGDEGNLQTIRAKSTLSLPGIPLPGDALSRLGSIKNLKELDLSDSTFDKDDFHHISQLKELQKLILINTPCLNSHLRDLLQLPVLENLDLSQSQVTDIGVEYLVEFKKLKELNIQGTRISPSGIAILIQSLPGCSVKSDR